MLSNSHHARSMCVLASVVATASSSFPTDPASTLTTMVTTEARPTLSSTTAVVSSSCEGPSAPCVGDITHWDGGMGACGWNVDTANNLTIALPVGFMGSDSNNNTYCGRPVTVMNPMTGVMVNAHVGDKCMGCVDRAIDCTDKLFQIIGGGDGRMSGIYWWLT